MKKLTLTFGALLVLATFTTFAADKRIVLIAGNPSHGPGDHEHRAGCLLLKSCLDKIPGVTAEVYSNGWPSKIVDGKKVDDHTVLTGADAIFIYSDGGGGHPAIRPERLEALGGLMSKGVGLGCCHYAVEVPKDKGGPEFLKWIGGYFETFWSVNPHWDADFKEFPKHPITRGVKPFKVRDEWYYHMRFPDGMKGTTPILTAVPPDSTRGKEGVNSPHGGNPEVQKHKGEPEHVMWATERPDGGRGFGVTGAHFHRNWADDNFRKLVLNALLWIAKMDVPADGVSSAVTPEQMKENLDPKGQPKPAAPRPAPKTAP